MIFPEAPTGYCRRVVRKHPHYFLISKIHTRTRLYHMSPPYHIVHYISPPPTPLLLLRTPFFYIITYLTALIRRWLFTIYSNQNVSTCSCRPLATVDPDPALSNKSKFKQKKKPNSHINWTIEKLLIEYWCTGLAINWQRCRSWRRTIPPPPGVPHPFSFPASRVIFHKHSLPEMIMRY